MLNEYALRFYALLEQSFKLDANDFIRQASIASIPYMEDADRKTMLDNYDHAGRDIIEEIREANSNSGIGSLREEFNK